MDFKSEYTLYRTRSNENINHNEAHHESGNLQNIGVRFHLRSLYLTVTLILRLHV